MVIYEKIEIESEFLLLVISHPWAEHGTAESKKINQTHLAMWKTTFHHNYGVCHSFNAHEGGMPNVTVGEDTQPIINFLANKPNQEVWMMIHNEHDFQDAQVLYDTERFKSWKANRSYKLSKNVVMAFSTKKKPCQKYAKKTCVLRYIHKEYIQRFNCSLIFIKDGLDVEFEGDYCNASIHQHFKENHGKMYQDNLKFCKSTQACKHINYFVSGRTATTKGAGKIFVVFHKALVEYFIEDLSYDLQSLIGEVGGTMGLTIGLSFLSIFEWALDHAKKVA